MTKQTWKVEPATTEDAEAMVDLTMRTLAVPETTQYKDIPTFLYHKEREHLTSPADLLTHRVRKRRHVVAMKGIHSYEVMHPSEPGKIIGIAMWQEPADPKTPSIDEQSSSSSEQNKPELPQSDEPPACLDQDAAKSVGETMGAAQKEIWGAGSSAYLYLMVFEVDADFRRQGIATQLMQPLYKAAIKAGLPIYVEASPLGKLFYQRCGFEVLKDVELFDGRAMLSPMLHRARA